MQNKFWLRLCVQGNFKHSIIFCQSTQQWLFKLPIVTQKLKGLAYRKQERMHIKL